MPGIARTELAVRVRHGAVELDAAWHGDAGEPLLAIMGLAMQRSAWPAALIAAWTAQGFRVLTFDNRDIGLSTRFDGTTADGPLGARLRALVGLKPRTAYTLADMAADARAVLDAAGVARAHVVGASMGGMIAQHLARLAPARVASLHLMMTTTGSGRLPPPKPHVLSWMLRRPRRATPEAAVAYQVELFRRIGSPAWPLPEAERLARAWASYRRAPAGSGPERQLAAIAADGSRRHWLPEALAGLPISIWHGEADPLLQLPHGQDLARLLPHARFETIPGWGHDLPEALAERLAAGMAAVAGVAGQPA